jgi:hypothetical protein
VMVFKVRYDLKGLQVGHPDSARTILEARQLALEGRTVYGADLAVILRVDRDGNEVKVESIKL